MKTFKVQLNTANNDRNSIEYIGTVGQDDYNAYFIEISVMHNEELLNFSELSDVAIQCNSTNGVNETYRLIHDNLTIVDDKLVFKLPASLMTDSDRIDMQLQLFTSDGRLTVLNRFMLEVKAVLNGSDASIEEEIIPITNQILSAINNKLDKTDGGVVSGNVEFIGAITKNGEALATHSDLNSKLDKTSGGTVSGNVNFTGNVTVDGKKLIAPADLDTKLDKAVGGTVSGNVDFSGDVTKNGDSLVTTADLDSKLDKTVGGTVSGNVDFTGDVTKNGDSLVATTDLDSKLDKTVGGTVSGNVDFSGDVTKNGDSLITEVQLSDKVDKELKTNSSTEYKVLSDNNLTNELVEKINNSVNNGFSGNYDDLIDIPSSFSPSPHTHGMSDIPDLEVPSLEEIHVTLEQAKTAADTAAEAAETATSLLEDISSHTYAGSSTAGGPADSANKLNTNAGSGTQPVYFSNGVPVNTTYTLGKSVPSNAVFTDTNTHYTSKNVVGSSTATSNTTSALTNGNVYINSVENGAVTSAHKISGSGATKVTTDTSGNIVITSTDNNTTYSAMTGATSSAAGTTGLVPAPASGKQTSFLRGDGTWVVPTNTTYSNFVKSGSGAKAGLVPAPSTTAGTTKYLREDCTWVTPPNTTYTLSSITGTLAVAKGGTGATTASGALTNLGLTATAAELNYCDGVTSAIQTQLNNKAAKTHTHDYLPTSGGTINGNVNITGSLTLPVESINLLTSSEVVWQVTKPSSTASYVSKWGRMVQGYLYITTSFSANTLTTICTLPAAYLPLNNVYFEGMAINTTTYAPTGTLLTGVIDTSGNLRLAANAAVTTSSMIRVTFCYISAS